MDLITLPQALELEKKTKHARRGGTCLRTERKISRTGVAKTYKG